MRSTRALYLVVSPASLVSVLPSLRTAIKNWYMDMEASMATLRPKYWVIEFSRIALGA